MARGSQAVLQRIRELEGRRDQVAYDSKVIYQYAQRLYNSATSIVVWFSILGALAGGGLAWVLTKQLAESRTIVLAVGAIVGLGVGYLIGNERAFSLRLQAQIALCQAQIEKNTRGGEDERSDTA